jgi:hypothetical protein
MMRTTLVLGLWTLAAVGSGCKSKLTGVGGKDGMMKATAAAKQCEQAAKGHDRPFVVEWDATDLASFEAKAARDTIVVRYEGCELEILQQCSDAIVPGKMGSYGAPQFTSGTRQGFDVKNEGELYAKLPLGAAKFASRVSAGEALHLEYFVTGVAMSSREALYQEELAKYPGCEGATHFVWAYNLGAFLLSVEEKAAIEAGVEAGNVGAGGRASTERASVGSGGNLESCESQDQRGCRVPIRLALRSVTDGFNPVDAPGTPPSGAGGDAPAVASGSQSDQAKALWDHARVLADKGDGPGCVSSLKEAMAADLRLMDQHAFRIDHARCSMMAGDCVGGSKDYRAALATADTKREMKDWQLDRKTRDMANATCPAATAKDDADYLIRAHREMKKAAEVSDAKTCERLIAEIGKRRIALHKDGIQGKPDFDIRGSADSLASNTYDPAAICVVSSTKKCKDGERILMKQCDVLPANIAGHCRQTIPDNWKRTIEFSKVDCK